MSVDVGGHYYAALAGLAVVWVVWLLLLIFWGRAKPPQAALAAPPAPTLAEMLRAFLTQLEAGTLDATAKAKMEMLLLRRWREELELTHAPISTVFDQIGHSEKTKQSLRQLEDWLHRPASKVRREDIAALITPYTIETSKPEAVVSPS